MRQVLEALRGLCRLRHSPLALRFRCDSRSALRGPPAPFAFDRSDRRYNPFSRQIAFPSFSIDW